MKKKVNLAGKLILNKETVARLSNQQMTSIKGGETEAAGCNTADPNFCDAVTGNYCSGRSADGSCDGKWASGWAVCADTNNTQNGFTGGTQFNPICRPSIDDCACTLTCA